MKAKKVLFFSGALAIAGYSSGEQSSSSFLPSLGKDKMSGCYTSKAGRPAEVKIEREGGKYFASFEKNGKWKKEQKSLVALDEKDIKYLFKNDADKVVETLAYPGTAFALFRFKAGEKVKGQDPASEYGIMFFMKGGSAYRTDLGCLEPPPPKKEKKDWKSTGNVGGI